MTAAQAPFDIVSLRMAHCRAEHAVKMEQFHVAALHYRTCLEAAERREDQRAMQFFALRLAECYDAMNMSDKAATFRCLAETDDLGLLP